MLILESIDAVLGSPASILLHTDFWASDPNGLNQKREMGPESLHVKRSTPNDSDWMLKSLF